MGAIRKRIFWLLDNRCASCEKVKGKIVHTPICRDNCSIYIELTQLGTYLDDPPTQKEQPEDKLSKEEYFEFKEEDWTDKDICHRLKITNWELLCHKKKWGLRTRI